MVRPVVGAREHPGGGRVVTVLGEAGPVDLEHVVGVHEVLEQQLPVRGPHVDLLMVSHDRHPEERANGIPCCRLKPTSTM